MHPVFADKCRAVIRPKKTPREVRVIDGRTIDSGLITHEATVELDINSHRELLIADLTNTGRYPYVLGTPWLVQHDPTIRWAEQKITFDSDYCRHTCIHQEKGDRKKVLTVLAGGGINQSFPTKLGRQGTGQETKIGGFDAAKGWDRQSKFQSPKHAMVSAATFRLSAKDAEVYTLFISEMDSKAISRTDDGLNSIPK